MIIIWDSKLYKQIKLLSGHQDTITRVIWSGSGLLYSCSHDKTIKIWNK